MPNDSSIDADRPTDVDRLGFSEMAKHLANAFLQNDLSEGFVVGVEGEWGSGKSSLVKMALKELRNRPNPPGIVEFQPWLVGNHHELLAQLFKMMRDEVQKINPSISKDAADQWAEYSDAAAGFGAIAGLAATGSGTAAVLSFVSKGLSWFAKTKSQRSLHDIKLSLSKQTENLPCPIVVFIDDLDRLDPSEAVEVLRLVRAVADFPNVAYILAYDPEVLAQNLEQALGVEDGRAYMEKIVQASFRVPQPMYFDLSAWLATEVRKLLPSPPPGSKAEERFASVFYRLPQHLLKTPRDVIRVLNAIRLYGVPVSGKTDPADTVFLQMVRVKMPKLYAWVEAYVAELSGAGDWNPFGNEKVKRLGASLLTCFGEDEGLREDILFDVSEHLPGIPLSTRVGSLDDFKVNLDAFIHDHTSFVQDRRLASPHHFRMYFAFSEPKGSISDVELAGFVELSVSQPEAASTKFLELVNTPRPQGGTLGLVLLYRLRMLKTLDQEQVMPLLFALAKGMDVVATSIDQTWNFRELLRGDGDAPFGLIRFLPKGQRTTTLSDFAKQCPSIAWLSGIVRTYEVEHGRQGDRSIPEQERMTTKAEFSALRKAYLKRVEEMPLGAFIKTPYLIDTLFGWSQAGGETAAKARVEEMSQSDEGFLELLKKLQSVGFSSSEGQVWSVNKSTSSAFWDDPSLVENRLQSLAAKNNSLSENAAELLQAVERGKRQ